MSAAAVQCSLQWTASQTQSTWQQTHTAPTPQKSCRTSKKEEPDESLAFYRKHTENLLRRYLYASMQVGRAPSILNDPISRGWVSSRPIRTFEDAVIFCIDMERCLDGLDTLDQQLVTRVVLQEYTQLEAAALVGMSVRALAYKFPRALDRLTERLLVSKLLIFPD